MSATDDKPDPNGLPAAPTRSGLQAAAILLWGRDDRLAAHDGRHVGRLWLWVGGLSLLWGVVLACTWALATHAFPWWHDTRVPLIPAAAVVAVMALFPSRQMLAAPAELLEPNRPAAGGVVTTVVLVVLTFGLLTIVPLHRQPESLPEWIAWLRPLEEYRVLILMPMWGAWAMMAPVHFGRAAPGADALVETFIHRQPVGGTALWMAVTLAATLWQLNFLTYGWVLLPPGLALAGGVATVAVGRLTGGITRRGLLGGNLLTQLAFLLGYLAGKTHLIT